MARIILSASSIADFKDCPVRFRTKYIHRICKIEDTESQRRGNIWHKLQEFIGLGSQYIEDELMEYINKQYEIPPSNIPLEDWLTERTIIVNSIFAFLWYYNQQAQYTVLVPEYKFEMPVYDPKHFGIVDEENVIIHGKIDQIIRDQDGILYIREFKSSSKSLDDDVYWGHLTQDVQTSLYLMAAQYLQSRGLLVKFGIMPDEPLISRVLYNVWKKPGINPTKLTQKDSKVLVETGEYCGQKFKVKQYPEGNFQINNESTKTELGAKPGAFAIYETQDIFGARLMQEITESPTTYFQQREISKTEQDMMQFATELYNIYDTIRHIIESNTWWSDDKQCQARFRCEYMQQCMNHIEITPNNIPNGFEKMENKNDKQPTKTSD